MSAVATSMPAEAEPALPAAGSSFYTAMRSMRAIRQTVSARWWSRCAGSA
jgi:hypothetical protein